MTELALSYGTVAVSCLEPYVPRIAAQHEMPGRFGRRRQPGPYGASGGAPETAGRLTEA